MTIRPPHGRTPSTPLRPIAVAALLVAAAPAMADEVAVTVENRSVPTLCAEEDNVYITFSGDDVTGLQLVASHPAYIGTLARDAIAPDFTDCDMTGDPAFAGGGTPGSVRIDVSEDMWLVAITYQSFWRPADVPLIVGDTSYFGVHLVQFFVKRDGVAEEVLVVYPPDGYWRARPRAPAGFDPGITAPEGHDTAYGSSFLVGPVTEEGRPVVALESLTFDPAGPGFDMAFSAGGSARLTIADLDQAAQTIDVTFQDIPNDTPFAAIRSMYVTATNNDAADVAWRVPEENRWREAPIMEFSEATTDRIWIGRVVPSRHNTSSPDHVFGPFLRGSETD